jgi:hypothetical protein
MLWVMHKISKANRTHIAWQPELRPDIPTVYGPLDYRLFKAQLEEIDRLLLHGGIENDFVREVLDSQPAAANDKLRAHRARNASLALRSNIARKILGLGYRELSVRVAESELLRWFLCCNAPGMARAPSKSTLERNDKILPPARMEEFNRRLIARCAARNAPREPGAHAPVDIDEAFIDATCLKANIHFPIDWVLLRDAARTLMKALALIRRHGLRRRMPRDPLRLLGEMNKLTMAMSACARKTDAKKQRKKNLRLMKQLARKISSHAQAHLKLLREERERTDLSEAQAGQIIARMENILAQLPAAIKQAHERIIGGRLLNNAGKIHSLYEAGLDVIVRGKAGAEVEFGRELLLCETREGLVSDYELLERGQSAQKAFAGCIERLCKNKLKPKAAWTDRGFCNKQNKKRLEQKGIRNGLCERDAQKLCERLRNEQGYAEGQKRRGATEARIAIIKKLFAGSPCKAKGREHTRVALGWAVLAHNLWVLARRELKWREAEKKKRKAR